MGRLGAYPPVTITAEEVWAEVTEPNGSVRVNKVKCDSCPFVAGSSFSPQLKRIFRDLQTQPGRPMQCHSTYPSDVLGAVCRGGYDRFLTKYIAKPHFIDQQASRFDVIPDPNY